MANVILFDLNGTLLDTAALNPVFRGIFGRKISVNAWFTELLQYAMAMTLASDYSDFWEIATSVLEMTAARNGIVLKQQNVDDLRSAMRNLPVFLDVKGALKRLSRASLRLAVLSNSPSESLELQLRNSGLDDYFERAISVDLVRRYKPAPEPYIEAARVLETDISDILMVAAHPWDLLGASRAGCRTALVLRPGAAVYPGAPEPDYIVNDLAELAYRLLSEEASARSSLSTEKMSGAWMFGASGIATAIIAMWFLKGSRRTE